MKLLAVALATAGTLAGLSACGSGPTGADASAGTGAGKSVEAGQRAGYLSCLGNLDNEVDACHIIYVDGWTFRDGDNLGKVRFNPGWTHTRYEACMNNPDSFSRSEVPNSCKAAAIANPTAAAFDN
ncbi:MAG: hypothetical protein ACT4QF_20710 [Sporichthyaceae bacterium]